MKIGDFLISDLKTIEKADFSNPPFTSQKQLDDYVWARQMPQRSKWYGFDLSTGKHKAINRYFDDNGNQTLYKKQEIPSVLEITNLKKQTYTVKRSRTFEEVKHEFKKAVFFEYDNLKDGRFSILRDYVPFVGIEITYASYVEDMTSRIAGIIHSFFPDKDEKGNSLANKFILAHKAHIQLAVEEGIQDVIREETDLELKNSMLIALAETEEEVVDLSLRIKNKNDQFYVFNCLNNKNTPKEILWNIEQTLKTDNLWKMTRSKEEQQNAFEYLYLHNNYKPFSAQSILDKLKAS